MARGKLNRTVEVLGLKEIAEKIRALEALPAQDVLTAASVLALQPVLEDARALAPVRTGLLRDSLRIAARRPRESRGWAASAGLTVARKIESEVAGNVPGKTFTKSERGAFWRWHWSELGTAYQAAHPYLLPAFEDNAGRVLTILRDELRARIEEVARK